MLLDTSAWIEFFVGGEGSRSVSDVLASGDCNTSIVTIAEVTNWAFKKGFDSASMIEAIERFSTVIPIDNAIAKTAGEINFERKKLIKKWGMMDSFILATAITYKLKVLTKDSDFIGLPDVEVF
jgi:predicted nucleic acid-binding protein